MKDEFKKTIIDIVERECAKLRELQNKLFRSFVERLCVCLYHLDKDDYEKAKDILLQTIIELESHQEGMEE
mgnify:FL=1